MCGIMGYIGSESVEKIVLEGLELLEYRGYDSAGIALSFKDGIEITKSVGNVSDLKKALTKRKIALPSSPFAGMGHTRWATHGSVSEKNAHPHSDSKGILALIHNGIIENYQELKEEMRSQGIPFISDTDTEVAAAYIANAYKGDPTTALRSACSRFQGTFAFVVLFADCADRCFCVRKGPPLVLGKNSHGIFCASDVTALLPHTREIFFMENCQIAELSDQTISLSRFDGTRCSINYQTVDWEPSMVTKGPYPHFMLKEIEEQPTVLRKTLAGRIVENEVKLTAEIPLSPEEAKAFKRIHLVACGTSYYASVLAGKIMDRFNGLDVRVETASEYRYGDSLCDAQTLAVFISQSGETADTLAAARKALSQKAHCLAVTNSPNSSLAREIGNLIELKAGPEIGVAATKTFIGQVGTLILLSLWIGKKRGTLSQENEQRLCQELNRIPAKIETILSRVSLLDSIVDRHSNKKAFLFIARGFSFPIALEGALKLKEISYLHAEAHAAGEMKHGPIALLDEKLPVIALAPKDCLYEKTISNIQEACARNAPIIAITTEGCNEISQITQDIFFIPQTEEELTPLLTTIPLQVFAYKMAAQLGREIDRPRNLAKSVTVE